MICLARSILVFGLLATVSSAEAFDCNAPHTRIDKTICGSRSLRQAAEALETEFADALARAPDKAADLRTTQQAWQADRDAGCVTSDHEAMKRCLKAQYRVRAQELALLVPKPPAASPVPPAGAAAAPDPALGDTVQAPLTSEVQPGTPAFETAVPPVQTDETIRPGAYISEAVILRFAPDGTFDMKDLAGARHANGHYAYGNGVLTLLDGSGDVGKTQFPLKCEVLRTADGFAVLLGQTKCRQLDGISFRFAA